MTLLTKQTTKDKDPSPAQIRCSRIVKGTVFKYFPAYWIKVTWRTTVIIRIKRNKRLLKKFLKTFHCVGNSFREFISLKT